MEHLFSALAFAGLIAGQFLAVVFVAHEHSKIRSSERRVPRDEEHEKYLALLGMTGRRGKFGDEEVWQ
jgi:hypothetical protein